MEKQLWLYSLPYEEHFAVVCFDERPCFLIGEVADAIRMQKGKVRKEHYAYEKNGSCALLCAIEPLTAKRRGGGVWRAHQKRACLPVGKYALFFEKLAAAYPKAKKSASGGINTHNASSFYELFPAGKAFALAQRFEFYYTPTSAGWLNMIEIVSPEARSALAKQCLDRRIPTQEQWRREVMAIVKERNEKQINIHWQFSVSILR